MLKARFGGLLLIIKFYILILIMTLRRFPCGFMWRHIYLSLLTCWMLVVSAPVFAQSQGVVSIAAAANLNGVLDALMQLYTKKTGQNLKVV